MKIYAAESVAIGHPDKVADQVSDAILDEFLRQDPKARVDISTLVSHNHLVLAGEISANAQVPLEQVARAVLAKIGYTSDDVGLDAKKCQIDIQVAKQSQDISQAIDKEDLKEALGAGDQGILIGYATDETEEFLPLPLVLANRLMWQLHKMQPILGPDGKTLVSVAYDNERPSHIHSIVLSCQHRPDFSPELLQELINKAIPKELTRADTKYFLNPSHRFVIGGPAADTGLTGRKQMVDSYGTQVPHGGGAFSGKDPTKVDRSAAYMARYIAKNIVAAKLARRCQITLTYVIGQSHPSTISLETFGTNTIPNTQIEALIPAHFDLTVSGIIKTLNLRRPIYAKTAFGGHFGRPDPTFTWENTDKAQLLSHE